MKPLAHRRRKQRARMEEERIRTQLLCAHRKVLDAPCEIVRRTYTTSYSKPFRVCRDCGFCEEGDDCGYQILILAKIKSRQISSATREHAFEFVVGERHRNNRFVRDGDIFDKTELYKRAVRGDPAVG